MKTKLLVLSAALLGSIASAAVAQDSAVTGAAGGAVTGAIVGGPVGAVVGGAVGAIAGTAVAPPPAPVVTYVQRQPMPERVIVYDQPVVIGERVPSDILLTPIPEDPTYAYAILNNQRVIVDPATYVVVGIVR